MGYRSSFVFAALLAAATVGYGQPGDCGAAICVQSGVSNWQTEVAEYCEADVCLRHELSTIADLNWRKLVHGRESVFANDQSPFAGLSDEEFVPLASLGDDEFTELVAALARTGVACRPLGFTLELDVPGRDVVNVEFGTAAAAVGGTQTLRVVRIDRVYRSLPGGSMGWWIRWISYRFPGIVRITAEPREFANYETGLYVARLVLLDKEFIAGAPDDYSAHPACEN